MNLSSSLAAALLLTGLGEGLPAAAQNVLARGVPRVAGLSPAPLLLPDVVELTIPEGFSAPAPTSLRQLPPDVSAAAEPLQSVERISVAVERSASNPPGFEAAQPPKTVVAAAVLALALSMPSFGWALEHKELFPDPKGNAGSVEAAVSSAKEEAPAPSSIIDERQSAMLERRRRLPWEDEELSERLPPPGGPPDPRLKLRPAAQRRNFNRRRV